MSGLAARTSSRHEPSAKRVGPGLLDAYTSLSLPPALWADARPAAATAVLSETFSRPTITSSRPVIADSWVYGAAAEVEARGPPAAEALAGAGRHTAYGLDASVAPSRHLTVRGRLQHEVRGPA